MNSAGPNPDHATNAPTIITMYGADWCGDCLRAKAFFAANGIDFDFVDLVEHELGTDVVLARNDGVQKIPVIIFPDNSHLTEPTNADLEAKMAELTVAAPIDAAAATGGTEATGQTDGRNISNAATNAGFDVTENTSDSRFELHRAGELVSFATYSTREDGVVVVPHVETIPEHRGQGNADRLMEGMLAQLRASDRKILPLCPFAARHIRDNPSSHDLLV